MRDLKRPLVGAMLLNDPEALLISRDLSLVSSPTKPVRTTGSSTYQSAFTLVELLVVIAVIAILAALLLPVLVRAKVRAQGAFCANNTKQLFLAWRMYADDNREELPFAYARQTTPPGNADYAWVQGELDNTNPGYVDNWNYDITLRRGAIWQYCGKSIAVWHFPADTSRGLKPRGERVIRRSYSMNNWIGGDGDSPGDNYKGGWGTRALGSTVARQLTQIVQPGPALTMVILDERQDSINNAYFPIQMDGYPNPATTRIVNGSVNDVVWFS